MVSATAKSGGIIILCALVDELPRDTLGRFQIEYSGVGKINAACRAADVINEYKPKLIINYGTAGRLNPKISGLVEIAEFVQRDMEATALGFALGETPFDEVSNIDFGRQGLSCGTGDSFVTGEPAIKTDVVDMEAYALAKVCLLKSVDFRCFKFISDDANDDASDDWQAAVAKGKELFVEKMRAEYPDKN